MIPELFDTKFSRVGPALFDLRHLPLPLKKYFIIFQKKNFAICFCADLPPANRINQGFLIKRVKAGHPIMLVNLFLLQYTFQTRGRVMIVLSTS